MNGKQPVSGRFKEGSGGFTNHDVTDQEKGSDARDEMFQGMAAHLKVCQVIDLSIQSLVGSSISSENIVSEQLSPQEELEKVG